MAATSGRTVRPVAIKIEADIKDRVKRLADARKRTPQWLMREAICEYVEREEKREALRQSAISAWNDYQATGLHLTLDEADFWLAKLEAGQDVDLPECHA